MPLPLTVSCFSKIQIGLTFLVLAHLGSPGQRTVKRVCVCACVKEPISAAYCGDGGSMGSRNSPLSGQLALSTTASVLFTDGTRITAVTGVITDNHTVLLVGTHHGRIVKVR